MSELHYFCGEYTCLNQEFYHTDLCTEAAQYRHCMSQSYHFQIREHPLYHLIKAQAKKKMGELTETIQTLQMAMSLPGVRRGGSSSKSKIKKIELSPADCVSVFLELAEALWLNGEQVKY